MSERNALITGANGFIGRRLCLRLRAAGWRVCGVSRTPTDGLWESSIAHVFGSGNALILPIRPKVVFHLAAHTHALMERLGETKEYYRTNVGGMCELITALGSEECPRVVFASSVKAHGEKTQPAGVDESAKANPTTPYGRSKLAAEKVLFQSALGRNAVVLRFAMVYGPGQKGNLDEMIKAVANNRFPPIPECSNRRSIVHVDDVVDALIAAAETQQAAGRTYFVSGARPYSSREMYLAILDALGRSVPRWHVPLSLLRLSGWGGDGIGWIRNRRFVWNSDKFSKLFGSAHYLPDRAMRELGFSPQVELAETLPMLVANLGKAKKYNSDRQL